MHATMHACMYVCMHVCMHAYMCACMYEYDTDTCKMMIRNHTYSQIQTVSLNATNHHLQKKPCISKHSLYINVIKLC